MISNIDWAKSEIERIRLEYERYLKEADIQRVPVRTVAGRENLKELERDLQEPYRIVSASTSLDDIGSYCNAKCLIETIDKALQLNP